MIQISLYICACQMSIMNTPLNYLLSVVFDAESCNRDCQQVIVFLLLISLALLDHRCAKCVLERFAFCYFCSYTDILFFRLTFDFWNLAQLDR